jgi:hypothetical protein
VHVFSSAWSEPERPASAIIDGNIVRFDGLHCIGELSDDGVQVHGACGEDPFTLEHVLPAVDEETPGCRSVGC